MENNVYIKKELISEAHFSDLDFELQNEFGFSYNDDDAQFNELKSGENPVDTYPIRIDRLIKALEKMAENGATHVELDYHCDHIGYDLAGFSITKASREEVMIEIEKERRRIEKEAARAELLRQLRELDKPEEPEIEEDLPF